MGQVIIKRNVHSRLPKSERGSAVIKLGSFLQKGGDVPRPISQELEDYIILRLLGIDPSNKMQAGMALKQYWAEFTIDIPEEGIELDVRLDDRGLPINEMDYVKYMFCKIHPRCATEPTQIANKSTYPVYLEDKRKTEEDKLKSMKVEQKAMKLFANLYENRTANKEQISWIVDMIKPITKVSTNTYTPEQVEIYLSDFIKSNPGKFVEIAEDKHLSTKAFIMKAIERGALTKIGNTILFGEDRVGDDMQEAVLFLENPKNSKTRLSISEQLKAFA